MAKIVQAQHSILGVWGHDYWVLLDDNNNRMDEIHGMARDSEGNLAPSSAGGTLAAFNGMTLDYSANTRQNVAAQGTMAEMQQKWEAGVTCARMIDEKHLDYSPFPNGNDSFNSNSVTSTVGACMNIQEVDLGASTPGKWMLALAWDVIEMVQNWFGQDDGPKDTEWPIPHQQAMPELPYDSTNFFAHQDSAPEVTLIGIHTQEGQFHPLVQVSL